MALTGILIALALPIYLAYRGVGVLLLAPLTATAEHLDETQR